MFYDDIYIYAMDIIIMALVLLPKVFTTSLKCEQYQSDTVLRSLKHLVLACVAFCFLTV